MISLLISYAVTRGFEQTHRMALELAYRADNRCESGGVLSQTPPRGRFWPGSGSKSTISASSPPPNNKPEKLFDCIGAILRQKCLPHCEMHLSDIDERWRATKYTEINCGTVRSIKVPFRMSMTKS